MSTTPTISAQKLTSGLRSKIRWQILAVLAKEDGLPTSVVAERVGKSAVNVSKLLISMKESGILERGYGKLYWIPKRFRVEGQPMSLDFGLALLRLDQMEKK